MGNLSLEEQGGAALPGTPVANSHLSSAKVYFPVVVVATLDADVCLAIIGQGLSFCLHLSCQMVAHYDV
jgi:hypothetical protein